MMKKLLLFFLLFINISLSHTKANNPPDEGMWLPLFIERLNYVDMKEMGLKLTPQEIYDINNSSLKDAVVNLGGFCTAEVVSSKGLLFTNHHCGYDAIQNHSSIEHDYLTDGFWAASFEEELPNEGLSVSFLVKMDDVTSMVLEKVRPEMNETERSASIARVVEILKNEAEEDGKYNVSIRSFYNGNEFYRFVYQVYNDVRLVGAPPSSIGDFGGDTDNWMWPRHTGDFSIFRIYTAPDGSPAPYAKENIPLNSKYHLKISPNGFEPNDFTMVWGFPASTDRFRTSYGIMATIKEINPAIVNLSGSILEAMKIEMDASDDVRIKYASHYAGLANYYKNKMGETRGLKRLNVYDKKKQIEQQFAEWVKADEQRQDKYGTVLNDIANVYNQFSAADYNEQLWYFSIAFHGSQVLPFPLANQGMINILKSRIKGEQLQSALAPFAVSAQEHFKDYDPETEKKVLIAILETFRKEMPAASLPDIYIRINKKYKGDISKYVDYLFKKSVLTTEQNFAAFIKKPSLKKLEKDPALRLTNSLYNSFMTQMMTMGAAQEKLDKARRLFVDGLRKANPDKVYYPDANSTLRISFGKVLDYFPADAIHFDYVTYADGIIEKEDPKDKEFIVPARLKELILSKDYGKWRDKEGRLPVCFITNNDITGGNSGSPVLNGKGELIGIAFDGNWEAMSGDIAFEPELQRTINVDIRYVLFIIDKFAGSGRIIEELDFASSEN